MDDLIAFLNARFDEDEQAARDAGAEAWRKAERPSIWVERGGGPVAQTKDFEDAAHIVRHDPARVLREVEAKRRIVNEMVPIVSDLDEIALNEGQAAEHPLRPGEHLSNRGEAVLYLLRLLALPYADHPDYREDWKP